MRELIRAASPRRDNRSFLAEMEQRLIRFLLPRFPDRVTPNHMTAIGLAGSLITGGALVGVNVSDAFLIIVPFGIVLNWFGDSLDGSLARFRRIERPRFGFLVDHTSDLFSQVLIIVGFGLSPFLSLTSALIVLVCYLMFSAYTYIRACAHHVHQMSYIGVGATEFRILMIVWCFVAELIGPSMHRPAVGTLTRLDLSLCILAAFALIGLLWKAAADARQIAGEEAPAARLGARPHPRPLADATS